MQTNKTIVNKTIDVVVNNMRKGLVVVGAIGALAASCGGSDSCLAPQYNFKAVSDKNISASEYTIGQTQDKQYNMNASCPDDCSYDSDKGCCWCPDE